MLDVSDEFKALTVRGAVVLAKIEYQLVDSSTWTPLLHSGARDLVAGSLDLTEQSRIRRTANIELGGSDAQFTSWTHPCSPLNRFRPYRGVRLSKGQVEWVRLGTFVVSSYARRQPNGRMELSLADYMYALDSDQLPVPVETIEDEPILPYIKRLITATDADLPGVVDPAVTPAFPGSRLVVMPGVDVDKVLPEAPVFTDGSRGEAVDYLARLLDAVVYANVDGDFVLEPSLVTSTSVAPVFRFTAGDGGTYSEIDGSGGFDDFANAVSIRNGDFVVESEITSGPLRVRSGFTHRYVEDVSTQSWDEDATQQYASRVIAEKLGLAETVQATVLPLPWLEPGDPVEVQGVDGIVTGHYLSSISGLPLGAIGTCTIDTRTLRLTRSVVAGVRSNPAATTRSIDPRFLAVYGDDETTVIAPGDAGEVAVLLCRADGEPAGGWAEWSKLFDGGAGLSGDRNDALSVWIGTGVGTGGVEVTGGTGPARIAVAVLDNVRGDLVLVEGEAAPVDSVPWASAAAVTSELGDVVITACVGADGYYPGDPLDIGVTGFSPLVGSTVVLTPPEYGLVWAVGIAKGGDVSSDFPMGGDGTGQAINVTIRSTLA